jgi:spore coat protein U-like protein
MKKILVLLFVALLGLAMATGAQAATATSNLSVLATILPTVTCTLSSPAVNFGVVPIGVLALNRLGSLSLTCSSGTPTSTKVIGICRGQNFDGAWRRMRRVLPSSLNYQRYGIYKGTTGTVEWGGQNCNLSGTYPFGSPDAFVWGAGTIVRAYNVDFISPSVGNFPGNYSDVALVEVDY